MNAFNKHPGLPLETTIETGSFAIGDIFRRSATLFGWYLIPVILIGGIELLPYVFIIATRLDYVLPIRQLIPAIGFRTAQYFRFSTVAALLLQYFTAAILIDATFQKLQTRKIRPLAMLVRAARFFLPLTLIGLFQSLGLAIGAPMVTSGSFVERAIGVIVFVIPSLFLGIIWFVATSIYVLEKHGVFASLARSAWLTHGHRWKLLGIFALVSIPELLVRQGFMQIHPLLGMTGFLLAYYLQTGVYVSFSVIIGVIVYCDLRAAKEGLDAGRIADVFD